MFTVSMSTVWLRVSIFSLMALAATRSGMLGTSALAAAATASASTQQLYNAGSQALHQGNLSGAEKYFRAVLARQPQDPGSNANLGVIYMRRQQWQPALRYLRRAERLAPKIPGIRLNIGLVYYRQDDFRSAVTPFESVVRDQPGSLQARYLLGLCYFFTERYLDAVQSLKAIWPQESDNMNYLYVLGIAASKAKQKDVEERALGRLVEIGQGSPEFHLLMGKAYLNRQEDDKALAEFQQAARGDFRLPFLHFNLGLAYLRKQDYEHARDEFLNDIAVEPDVAFNYDQLGEVYSLLGNDDKAELAFREALRRDSTLGGSFIGLAKVYQKKGKYAEAMKALNSAAKLEPDNYSVHYLKGQVLRRMGQIKRAITEVEVASRMMNARRSERQRELSGDKIPDPQLKNELQ
jgi:tetratricopeptide (TPR) repeat protein